MKAISVTTPLPGLALFSQQLRAGLPSEQQLQEELSRIKVVRAAETWKERGEIPRARSMQIRLGIEVDVEA